MKKLEPDDQIVKIDDELGIAWILLPPDEALGGFRGISPRVMNEEKFLAAKKKVNPVRNSSGALNPAGIILKSNPAAEQRGIISNGVKEEKG